MINRITMILAMAAGTGLAHYAHAAWRDHSKEAGCHRSVAELRQQFEQRRADIKNPRVLDDALTRAADLCAERQYDKARKVIDMTLATCRHNSGCVLKKRG
jgi:hypothetical protein